MVGCKVACGSRTEICDDCSAADKMTKRNLLNGKKLRSSRQDRFILRKGITRVLMLLTRFRSDLALRHLAHSSLKLYRFAYPTSE